VKIRTTYIPTDTAGNEVSFTRGVYTLADLQKLGADLAAAGVGPTDSLMFDVHPMSGALAVICEKTVE
jgi:hypothetical protein